MPHSSKYLRLYRATHEAVRSLLSRRNPQMFCFPVQRMLFEIGEVVPEPSIEDVLKPNTFTNIRMKSDGLITRQRTLDSLAALNGYKKLSEIKRRTALAEGVVAVQNGNLLKYYSIYSRPSRRPEFSTKHAQESSGSKPRLSADDNDVSSRFFHPPFYEEDFTLYRILETRLDMYLNSKKEAWMRYITNSPVAKVLHSIGMYYKPSKSEDNTVFQDLMSQSTEVLDVEGALQEAQDLLIFYQGKLVVVEQVPPNCCLLSLPPVLINTPRSPYKLKHNTASSIIYAAFVTFGALPFAYRSIKYAIDYPAMVEILLASFFGTLAYSTWYSRYGARVRQQLSIERAVGSRVVARDDAVLALLVEGAVSNVTKLVLGEYAARLSHNERADLGLKDPIIQHGSDSLKTLAVDDIDPVAIAYDLGFLLMCGSEKNIVMPRSVSDVIDVIERYKVYV